MTTHNRIGEPFPNILALILAMLCISMLAFLVALLSLPLGKLERQLAFAQIRLNLAMPGLHREDLHYYQEIITKESSFASQFLYSFFKISPPPNFNVIEKQTLAEISDFVLALKSKNTEEISTKGKLLFALLSEEDINPEHTNEIQPLVEDLKTTFDKYISVQKQLNELNSSFATEQEELKSKIDRYQLIARDFGALLTLMPESIKDENEDFPIYSKGIFANMPILKELPDEIGDLSNLKILLENIGGKVRIEGEENQQEAFAAAIARLRQASEILIQDFDNAKEAIQDLKLEQEAAKEILKNQVVILYNLTNEVFLLGLSR